MRARQLLPRKSFTRATCRFLEKSELRVTDEKYYKRTVELAKNVIERATSRPPLLLSFMCDQQKRFGGAVSAANLSVLYSSTGMPVCRSSPLHFCALLCSAVLE